MRPGETVFYKICIHIQIIQIYTTNQASMVVHVFDISANLFTQNQIAYIFIDLRTVILILFRRIDSRQSYPYRSVINKDRYSIAISY